MDKKIIIGMIAFLFAIGAVTVAVRSRQAQPQASGKLEVTTSFYPLYFFASKIGGDKAEVMDVTPSGAEPHDYEPSAQDVARIEDSRLLVLNGGGLEAWGGDIKKNIDTRRTLVVTAGEGLTDRQVMEDGKEIVDPHVWLSPPLAKLMVDRITDGFIQADAADAAFFRTNAVMLKAELDDLDASYKMGLKDCKLKEIITSHAAFGYLAQAYGLDQVAIAGLSPDAEPSPQQLAQVAAFAKAHAITTIFFESLVSPRLSQTIATEVGAQTMVLDPIEGLSAEAQAQGKDYFSVMRTNLDHLQTALQCTR